MSDFFGDDGSTDPFWGQLGHEEEAPAEEPAPQEVAAEPIVAGGDPEVPTVIDADEFAEATAAAEQTDERPRDEKGRFTKAEEAPDPAALQEQIAQLEKRLADKDEFNGRLSNELGELRRLQEQQLERVSQPHVSDWDTLIDENPARAAKLALERGDGYHYQRAKDAWEDLYPGAPEVFETNLRLQHQIQDLERKLTATTEPLQVQQQTAQIASAYTQIKTQYPDFDKFEEAMAETIESRPLLKQSLQRVLQEGNPHEQVAALEDLYLITAGRKTDTLREAAKEVAREHAAETMRAKQEAIVASATATADVEKPKTATDVWWEEAEADIAGRAAGWNIGK